MNVAELHVTINPARRHGQHCAGRCIARAYASAVGLVALMAAIGAVFGPH